MLDGRRRRAQTLAALADVARRVTAGDLARRVPAPPDAELDAAVAAFNAMVDDLARTRRKLVHEALHDPLTGLPNRSLFADRVAHALSRTRGLRARTGPLAVLFLDLDGFKQVNDTYGHEAGDLLLATVSARLADQLRPHDTVARFGGDEFAILLDDLARPEDAGRIADRLIAAVCAPVVLGAPARAEVHVGVSIGVAHRGTDASVDTDELLRRADTAMYAAKAAGRGCHRAFEDSLAAAEAEQASLEGELGDALNGGALTLAYEPVVDLATRRTVALGAVVRWQHPAHGALPETRVHALAADAGLAVALGRWTLEHACRQAADLRGLATGRPLTLWVPLGERMLRDGAVATDVARALRGTGLPPDALVLAVPEAALTRDPDAAADALAELAALGVGLAVDGFGTGSAGLAHLRSVPFGALRLDGRLLIGGPDGALVRASVAMARALGLEVTVPGVERADQVAPLRALGCAHGQGPLLGAPLPHAALAAQLVAEAAAATAGAA